MKDVRVMISASELSLAVAESYNELLDVVGVPEYSTIRMGIRMEMMRHRNDLTEYFNRVFLRRGGLSE